MLIKHLLFLSLSFLCIFYLTSCSKESDDCENGPQIDCVPGPTNGDIRFEILNDQNNLTLSDTDTFKIINDFSEELPSYHDTKTLFASLYSFNEKEHEFDLLLNNEKIGSISYDITTIPNNSGCNSCPDYNLEYLIYNNDTIPLDSLESSDYFIPLHL